MLVVNGELDRRSASSLTDGPAGLGRVGLAVILSAQLVVTLDFSIVNVALPSISNELHAASTAVQWVVTAYAITFGGLLVVGGRAADLFGRRRLFIAGLAGFAVASAAAGVATSLPFLVVARCRARRGCRGRGARCFGDPDHHFPRRAGQNSSSWLLRHDGIGGIRRRAGTWWRARRDNRLAGGLLRQRVGLHDGGYSRWDDPQVRAWAGVAASGPASGPAMRNALTVAIGSDRQHSSVF
jgi:hypothetical protein